METSKDFKGLRFDGIQLLRTIAALMVAFYHIDFMSNMGIKTGVGVDIFFVISGFIIMYTTQQGIKDYGKKRIIKIVPLYWLLTIITYLSTFFIDNVVPYKPTIMELIMSLFFIPYSRDGLKEQGVIRPIVGPAHTLLKEMFFYLVFYIAAKINHKKRGEITIGIILVLITIGCIFNFGNIPILNVGTSKELIDFALGIVLFYILKKIYIYNNFKIGNKKSILLTFFGIVMILTMVLCNMNIFFRAILALLIVLCFSISFFNLKAPKILLTIGDISYSFYLIHYYVILIFRTYINSMSVIGIKEMICAICAIITALIISYISYQIIEVKFANYLKNKFIKKDEINNKKKLRIKNIITVKK